MRNLHIVDNVDPPDKHRIFQQAAAFATICPLLAAVVAPLSILLDIPALSETWYTQNGSPLPDPRASLILSGISLALSIAGDALLLVRFTVWEQYWVLATHVSVLCWVAKWVVGLSNLIVFGVESRNAPQFEYDEGFWCSVLAFLTSSVVIFLLLFHWTFTFIDEADAYSRRVRRHGRHFMFHNLSFTCIVGVTAAIMLRLEGWSYLQCIYFSVVTFTTIGFGDFYPTTTASRIVMFPLALIGIAELSALISLLIGFFSNVHKDRLARSRLRFERERRLAQEENSDPRTLEAEIEWLEELHRKRSWRDHAIELGWSMCAFLTFWMVGAVIFSKAEGWGYGTGLYFVYVFFFAIGYGDIYVQSPAGRVVFVVYALMAVPVMTSFAVQTIAGVFSRFSSNQLNKDKARVSWKDPNVWKPADEETAEPNEKEIVSHAEYVYNKRRELDEKFGGEDDGGAGERKKQLAGGAGPERKRRDSSNESRTVLNEVEKHEEKGAEHMSDEKKRSASASPEPAGGAHAGTHLKGSENHDDNASVEPEEEMGDEDTKLTMELLDVSAELERVARRLLINNLPPGSPAQILLKADWHVQLQEMRAVLHEEADAAEERKTRRDSSEGVGVRLDDQLEKSMRERVDREADLVLMPLGGRETMEAITRYRQCFATMLVLGSRLSKLKGRQQFLYERRKAMEEE